jgi:hypothetical protein
MPSTPPPSQRATKSRLTYEDYNLSSEEEEKREESEEEEYQPKKRNREEKEVKSSKKKPRRASKPIITLSPIKKRVTSNETTTIEENSQEDDDEVENNISTLLNFQSFQSPMDHTWWSYIKTIPGLKPTINTKDPHKVKITFKVEAPTNEQLEGFPEGFQAGIACPTNRWLLVCIMSYFFLLFEEYSIYF